MKGALKKLGSDRDEDEVLLEDLLARMRHAPGDFSGVGELRKASGLSQSQLEGLFREHAHSTPERRLEEARIDYARRSLVETERSVSEIALDAGYGDPSSFSESFLLSNGLTPEGYRSLLGAESFEIFLPMDFPAARVLRYLTRDSESRTVQAIGATGFREGVRLGKVVALAEVELGPGSSSGPSQARCRIRAAEALGPRAAIQAHGWLLRRLGLQADVAGFQRLAGKIPEMAPLLRVEQGLRIPQTGTPFEALTWAIVGQQVNLAFAYRLLNRVVERAGVPVGEGLHAPPLPEAVAALSPQSLQKVQFSRSKAEYIVGSAERVASGAPNLQDLGTGSAVLAERELVAVRGIGKWTARYVLMRGLGF